MGFWLIQAVGLLGSAVVLASVQFNNRRVVLLAQAAACCLWIVHYWYLGAMTAVFTNFISFARSFVFYNNDKRWARGRFWLWLFVGLFLLNSALTWDGWPSLLPGAAMTCTTLALWTADTRRMRLFYLAGSPFWLGYDLLCGSYSCAATECVALVSYIVAVFRFDLGKRPEKRGKPDVQSWS